MITEGPTQHELLEQHAITLAIQAAHEAAEWQRRGAMPKGGAVLYGSGATLGIIVQCTVQARVTCLGTHGFAESRVTCLGTHGFAGDSAVHENTLQIKSSNFNKWFQFHASKCHAVAWSFEHH